MSLDDYSGKLFQCKFIIYPTQRLNFISQGCNYLELYEDAIDLS